MLIQFQTIQNIFQVKCEKYFPDNQEKLEFGGIEVNNKKMIVDNEHLFTTRVLTVIKVNKKLCTL